MNIEQVFTEVDARVSFSLGDTVFSPSEQIGRWYISGRNGTVEAGKVKVLIGEMIKNDPALLDKFRVYRKPVIAKSLWRRICPWQA